MTTVDQRIGGAIHTVTTRSGSVLFGTKTRLVLVDLLAVAASGSVASMLVDPGRDRWSAMAVLVLGWWFWLSRARLYSARFITRRSDEIRRIFDSSIATAASIAVVAYVAELHVARGWLAVATLLGFLVIGIEREVVRAGFDRRRRNGELCRRVVMIGANEEARQLVQMFQDETELGYQVVATIDPRAVADRTELTTRVLAEVRRHDALGVVVAASSIETKASNRLVRDLVENGIHVELSSTLIDIEPGRLTVRPLGRFPVVYIEAVRRRGWRALAKRVFDVVVSLTVLLLASPILAVLAIVIRRHDGGPVLFRQSRVGQHGVPFDMLKLRSMVTDAEERRAALETPGTALFKLKDDPRVTPIGKFIRKTSLDELPQLWNVVRGEMSLVGPRPALWSEMEAWEDDLYGRLRVRPGITGMWQVSGRSSAGFEQYTRLDLYYVDNWSLVIDLSILLRTIPAVLRHDGAY
jgi:exopolysaccharide biosynthesis polyprenyl glycosylphosphotransferase